MGEKSSESDMEFDNTPPEFFLLLVVEKIQSVTRLEWKFDLLVVPHARFRSRSESSTRIEFSF